MLISQAKKEGELSLQTTILQQTNACGSSKFSFECLCDKEEGSNNNFLCLVRECLMLILTLKRGHRG